MKRAAAVVGAVALVALGGYYASNTLVTGGSSSGNRVKHPPLCHANACRITSTTTSVSTTTTTAPTTTTEPTTTVVTSTVCSRATLAACPASYFTGPLGANNLIPDTPRAFLFDVYGGIGTTWEQLKAGVLQREADIGRPFDGLGFHYDGSGSWGGVYGINDPTSYSPLPEQWIHDHGSIPLIVWTPNYTLDQMNAGQADLVWTKAAIYWKQFPFTVMLRAFNEFDGQGLAYQGCGAAFISAWQRMVGIFQANGATNVGFWWNPTEGQNRACIASSYPGDSYVDWVGSDWYNVCQVGNINQWCSPLHSGWSQFAELFNYTALGSPWVSQHDAWGPHKPFVIGETGSWYDHNYPGYKGAWQAAVAVQAEQMHWLRGIEFYDSDVSAAEGALNNFRVDYPSSDPSVYQGWLELAASPWFGG